MTAQTRAGLALIAIGLTVAGCGTTTQDAPAQTAAPSSMTEPKSLTYDSIGVAAAPLTPTGLDAGGAIDVPELDRPAEVDFLRWAPNLAPGRPTVLVSHVNGRVNGEAVPGTFAKLGSARRGDMVTVTDTAGKTVTYAVTSVVTVDKDKFPTSVYDAKAKPTLLMITCGGVLNHAEHSYESNVITTAEAS